MIMATNLDPQLCSTGLIEDSDNSSDLVGLKLSYIHNECFFTVFVLSEKKTDFRPVQANVQRKCVTEDLISRFNEACKWTETCGTTEDVDERLDSLWQEAEDLVRSVAFSKIRWFGREHGCQPTGDEMHDRPKGSLADYLFPRSFNFQVITYKGVVDVVERPDLPPCLPFATEPDVKLESGLIIANPQEVQIVELYRAHVLKVRIGEEVFCCKLNNTGAHLSFQREFMTLQKIRTSSCRHSLRIPWLRGVVMVKDGIVGLIMDLVETKEPDLMALLSGKDDVPHAIKQRWTDQISDTLAQLHSLNIVWGDAKTGNVLIDRDDNAWLIDFGGGFTRGWIDESIHDTRAGDLQGLANTILDLFGKR